ncbi:putative WRKY transcription factor 19 [Phytophthora citrophthora]|uniref:WRKY transcription factor 19 n=1 Tax=Phytophthora citrophthora TaxID=4793 RepID=A0AAD9H055_9STRA|nr:putative WRKY transcription factor 19 [Phytophthora citrophthora]
MSEVADAGTQSIKPDAPVLQPPTDNQGHPVREWIDTLLQAADIAKDKHKKPVSGEVDATPAGASATVTAADMAIATSASESLEVKAVVTAEATLSEENEETEGKSDATPAVEVEAKDSTMDTSIADTAKVGDASEIPAPKRYRRRRCEVEGCTKFARFNNCCSGHGGRRLCVEAGCERVAQFGHKCSAHGGVKFCSVEGCRRAVQSRGCCKTHGGGVRCQYPDCTKGAISKGFCRSHGGGSRCAEQDCKKWAQRHGYCVRHSKSAAAEVVAAVPMTDVTIPALE